MKQLYDLKISTSKFIFQNKRAKTAFKLSKYKKKDLSKVK